MDWFEVECDGSEPLRSCLAEGRWVAACEPQRGMSLAVGLRQDVVRRRDGEVLAVVAVVALFPHPRDFADDLVPHGLCCSGFEPVECRDFMAACASTGAELETASCDVIEHRGALREAHRVFLGGREAGDASTEVDVVGLCSDVSHHDLWGRHVAVLGEGVVLAEPDVFPVVFVGEDRVLGFAHEHLVLACAVMSCRPWQVAIHEDPEFHCCPLGFRS